uniref:Uncharacterized protein n=1 Tax=Picea glauca TaxID=3330 RepID=A0A101M459_PICGL|nr:hypothetical protein ABT39_MTgene509 [Picea glauca]QHR89438.1 hypothetical protein Q903MT_gene3459 [Picea sitchensis]
MAGSLSRSESATGITAFGAAPGYGYETTGATGLLFTLTHNLVDL